MGNEIQASSPPIVSHSAWLNRDVETHNYESVQFAETSEWNLLSRNKQEQVSVVADRPYTTSHDIKDKDGKVLFEKGHTFQTGEKIPVFISSKALETLKNLPNYTMSANPGIPNDLFGNPKPSGRVVLEK